MSGRTVWLASYPKSGNTWFRAVYAAWRAGTEPDLGSLGTIASSRERFEDALSVPSSDLSAAEVASLRPAADDVADSDSLELHLEKIHDRLTQDSTSGWIVSPAATHCALYLVRDPRDVAVSLAFHNETHFAWSASKLSDEGAAISDRTDDISDQLLQRLGTWSEHVRSWVEGAPFPVHPVRFEDCLADPLATFDQAFHAAGFRALPEALATAVERSSFRELQAQEAEGGFRERRSRAANFFRQGTAGGWREELSLPLVAAIEAAHGEVMTRFGYLPD